MSEAPPNPPRRGGLKNILHKPQIWCDEYYTTEDEDFSETKSYYESFPHNHFNLRNPGSE